ncbi:signal peptidase I [Candidatus Saccharibacteria bacterium]|nr:signal peptidase I [Candidatus Saccharibacteria bacterium]
MIKKKWLVLIIYTAMVVIHGLALVIPANFYDTYFNILRPLAYIALVIFAYFSFGKNYRLHGGKTTLTMVAILGVVLYVGFTFAAGLFTNFAANAMDTSPLGLLRNGWAYLLVIVIRELLRAQIMTSFGEKSKYWMCIVMTIVFTFCCIDNLPNVLRFDLWQQVDYIFTTLLPLLALNLWLSYSALNGGLTSNLIFICAYYAVALFCPILPNIPKILDAIAIYCITFIMFIIYDSIEWMAKRRDGLNVQYHDKRHWWVMIFPGIVLAVCVMFGLGIFPIIPVAVASDSMSPEFKHGDLVYVIKIPIDDLERGDILQYTQGNISIVHRIIDIKYTPSGARYFVTQGDNNATPDVWPVYDHQVVGKAIAHTPFIGWPALLFQGLRE